MSSMIPDVDASDRLRPVLDALGTPAFHHPQVLIYQGDCLAFMESLTPLADLTITSPPYNIGKEYEQPLPLPDYLDWCERWIGAIHDLSKPTAAFWLNLGYVSMPGRAKAIPLPYLLWDRIPFFLLQEIVWNYGAGVAARKMLSPRNEKFLWYVKSPEEYIFNLDAVRDPNVKYPTQRKNGKLKCNPLGKNPTDVWQFPKVTSGRNRASKERQPHPAQFPVAVIDRIVRACSNPGDLLMDPFLGSGTVAEAALRTGRCAVGFELNPRYVQVAADRIRTLLEAAARDERAPRLF